MVVDNNYKEGLDSLLNRKINTSELSETTKGILYFLMEGLPGVGLAAYGLKEYKTRKGKTPLYDIRKSKDRRALGVYALEVAYLAFAIGWKVYVGKGVATGNWHPLQFNSKDKTEQFEKINEKKGNLEKTINYEELFK